MTDSVTTDPAQALAFGVVPPSIDVSTPASKQMFAPQLSVANLSTTAAVNLQRAQLLVPVTTAGTNLAGKSDMSPCALTPGWTFECCTSPQAGYAAFTLVPNDGVGAIAPGGSVAFALSNVEVTWPERQVLAAPIQPARHMRRRHQPRIHRFVQPVLS
jgi:hypothetical protein